MRRARCRLSSIELPPRLPIVELPAATELCRIHLRSHSAVWFNRGETYRFNAPAGEYGVCYLGNSLEVSFLETLLRGAPIRIVSRAALAARFATTLPLARPLRLVQLHSQGLVALRLSADVPHREPYQECQQLALSLWQHREEVDGIEYRSRWDDSRLCVALFDRASAALGVATTAMPLDDLGRVRPILRHYGIRVI